MNALDVIILVVVAGAVAGGWETGFASRILSWVGLGIGIYLGVKFGQAALSSMTLSSQSVKLAVLVSVVAGTALIGQAIGLLVGSKLARFTMIGPLRLVDKAAGAVLGLVSVMVLVWVLTPTLASTAGMVANQTRHSAIVQAIGRIGPSQPAGIRNLRGSLEGGWFPQVFNGAGPSPNAGPPPSSTSVSPAVIAQVEQSTVKVTGEACNVILDGSGFSAFARDLVVTNAHVVAGEQQTYVLTPTGLRLRATVVAFDEKRDVALLAVPGLAERDPGEVPLPFDAATVGSSGVTIGHPGGTDSVVVTPVRITQEVDALGRDLYDQSNTSRYVYVLAADIQQGDSGSPVISPGGQAEGLVFALAPDQPSTGYALAPSEVSAVYANSSLTPVSTGPCING